MIMQAKTLPSQKFFRILLAIALVVTLIPLAALSSVRSADAATTKIVNGDFSYATSAIWNCSVCGGAYIDPINSKYQPLHFESCSHKADKPYWRSFPSSIKMSDFGWKSNQTYDPAQKLDNGEPACVAGCVELRRERNGNVFAELTAHQANTYIYQDIATVPGAVYKWSLKHCSRSKTHLDSMSVMIGTTANQVTQSATRLSTNGLGNKTGNVGTTIATPTNLEPNIYDSSVKIPWERYEGVYIVPDGQTTTRFTFKSVSANSPKEGNLVDDITFTRSFALNYDLTGGSASGIYTDPKANNYAGYHVEGGTVTLTSVKPTRSGYTFLGWSRTKVADITSKSAYDAAKSKLTSSFTMPSTATTIYAVWAKNPTVAFVNGTGTTLKSQAVTFGTGATAPGDPARIGYTFTGWSGAFSNVYSDTIITAQWKANSYSVSFDSNSGEGAMEDQGFTYDQAKALSSNAFTKLGYTFIGWNAAADGAATSFVDKQEVLNLSSLNGATIPLFAQWRANSYQIVFNANSGEGFMGEQTLTYDTASNLHGNLFVKQGYRFTGWNTEPDGSGKTYHNKQAILNLAAEDGSEVTLYAQWQPVHYSVVFFGNGGIDGNGGVMSAYQKMIFDTCEELAENIFEREGYTWQSWNSDVKGNGATYTDKQAVKNLSDVAGAVIPLYSQWAVNKYSVSYDANGGEGSMTDQPFLYDHAKALSKNSFTKPGYAFQGWSTEPSGVVAYEDSQTVLNLTSTDDGKVALYAVWEEDPDLRIAYVAHDPNKVSVSSAAEELAPATGSPKGSSATPEKGYKFKAWKTAKGDTVSTSATFIPKRGSDGLWHAETYFAYADPIDYKIIYDANGADGVMTKTNATYDEPVALTKNAFKHEGWRFLGWNTEADGSGTSYANKQSVINLATTEGAEVVLYAQWEQKSFNVDFTDGQGSSLSSQIVDYGQGANAPAEPSREGYTFTGWDKAYDKITSDTTVNAKWRINSYTIAYDANSGEGMMSDQTLKYDEKAKLSANNFDRAGHVFIGWNTSSDGSGTAYKNEQEVSKLTAADGERITLFAQWKIERFSVTFEDGMGNIIDRQEVDHGSDAAAPVEPTREGYKFQGWDGNYTNVTKDMTIKASWTTADKESTPASEEQMDKQAPEGGDYAKTGSNTLGWILFAGAFMVLAVSVLWAERKRK